MNFIGRHSWYFFTFITMILILLLGRSDFGTRLWTAGFYLAVVTLLHWKQLAAGNTSLIHLDTTTDDKNDD